MDVFFNELSIKIAANDNEACKWIEDLVELGYLLRKIAEQLRCDDSFRIKSTEEFLQRKIIDNQSIFEFLHSNFEPTERNYAFFLGIFDSPSQKMTHKKQNMI